MDTSTLRLPRPETATPAGALLDTWTAHSWSDGLCVTRLSPLDRLSVQTRNSLYEIIVLSPPSPEILVRGGTFFPEFTRVWLAGASLGGSFLKLHGIYIVFRLELVEMGRSIITSTVQSIALVTDRTSRRPM